MLQITFAEGKKRKPKEATYETNLTDSDWEIILDKGWGWTERQRELLARLWENGNAHLTPDKIWHNYRISSLSQTKVKINNKFWRGGVCYRVVYIPYVYQSVHIEVTNPA